MQLLSLLTQSLGPVGASCFQPAVPCVLSWEPPLASPPLPVAGPEPPTLCLQACGAQDASELGGALTSFSRWRQSLCQGLTAYQWQKSLLAPSPGVPASCEALGKPLSPYLHSAVRWDGYYPPQPLPEYGWLF